MVEATAGYFLYLPSLFSLRQGILRSRHNLKLQKNIVTSTHPTEMARKIRPLKKGDVIHRVPIPEGASMNAPVRIDSDWYKPGRLWSLLDMLRVNAIGFARSAAGLAELRRMSWVLSEELDLPLTETDVRQTRNQFVNIVEAIKPLNLEFTERAISRWYKEIGVEGFSHSRMREAYADIESRFFDELGSVFLYTVDSKNAELFDPSEPPFGEAVAEKLRELAYDIEEAGKCLALRRSTACVLHLNRVLEGLAKRICKRLKIPQPERSIGLLLPPIDAAIGKMKKGKRKEEWALVRANLFHVKEAWRNPSAHARNIYTEEDAEAIYAAMRFLVRHYAEKL